MTRGAAFRGQPLLMLSTLLLGWMILRVAVWESPLATPEAAARVAGTLREAIRGAARDKRTTPRRTGTAAAPRARRTRSVFVLSAGAGRGGAETLPLFEGVGPLIRGAPIRPSSLSGARSFAAVDAAVPQSPLAVGNLAAPFPVAAPPRPEAATSPWSADAWVLVRQDNANSILAGRPSYGRSQAGGVVRYRLSAVSPLQPQAYVRASTALAGASEREVAGGVSVRLLPDVPLRFFAEGRVGETALGTQIRPATFVVTEFAPLSLPLGARAEVYAQGGYVGGDYATGFVDGQARVERPVLRNGKTELSAGGGLWGGAQRDAARLDIGPTAALSFPLGKVRGRVTADYRFRIAGAAAPASGPALTLSAGF